MKILSYLDSGYEPFVRRLSRRALPEPGTRDLVTSIIAEVAAKGDEALLTFTKRFDGAALTTKTLFISEAEFSAAEKAVTAGTKAAVARSLKNIHSFAKRSLRKDWSAKNAEGAMVGERFSPLGRVGVYVPGGKAPLVSTALMTAGFAQAAGVPEILAATPCGQDGTVNPALLYALNPTGGSHFRAGEFFRGRGETPAGGRGLHRSAARAE
jgi:histidinol dehydrogenase